ncbi:MAG TPA: hypothetical protein VNR86_07875 [Sphingomicrobium sp.]|nr:hypothetical protein [Sphingomicrobium sp.]
MPRKSPDFPDDKTAPERRKNLTEEEIRDLELAGGVEGGMQAGSGGPKPRKDRDKGTGSPADKARGKR